MTDDALANASDGDQQWLDRYTGLDLTGALEVAEVEGRVFRVINPGDAVTMDWRPDRLNLMLAEDGSLERVWAG